MNSQEPQNERWYVAVTARGYPADVVNRIFDCIPKFGLEDFITRVSHERGIRKRGEFYLFLGVSSAAKGSIPAPILSKFRKFLDTLNLWDQGIYLSYEEFEQMASKEMEGRNLRQLRMLELPRMPSGDPFTMTGRQELSDGSSQDHEKLLRWLSAVGSGSWNLFQNTCHELGIAMNSGGAWSSIRRLETLGHIEMYSQRRKWIAAPSCLVECASRDGTTTYFLAGKRSEAMLDVLRQEMAIVKREPQSGAPDRIIVTFPSEQAAQRAARNVRSTGVGNISFPGKSGFHIALTLPPIQEWPRLLTALRNIILPSYTYKQWQISRDFVHIDGFPHESGLYELERITNASYKPVFRAFFDAEADCWYRGDFYGLRYLTLSRCGTATMKAFYDDETWQLVIHKEHRWPDLYERAAVLASGWLPTQNEDGWLQFKNIPSDLAYLLTDKLNMELVPQNIG